MKSAIHRRGSKCNSLGGSSELAFNGFFFGRRSSPMSGNWLSLNTLSTSWNTCSACGFNSGGRSTSVPALLASCQAAVI
jgi:hypothetical protein